MTQSLTPLGPATRHYWLALRMAKATETDLSAAVARGELSAADWADLVHRCRGCTWADACDGWTAAHLDDPAEVPDRCPNAALFADVKGACGA